LALATLLPSLLLLVWQLVFRPRRGPCHVALHATLVTGACGMAWSLLLFFSFQSRVGVLYSQLGALSAVFMLGLAGGGAWSARRPSLVRAQGLALAHAVVTVFAFIFFDRVDPGRSAVALLHALLLALGGVATGSVFPAAASRLLKCGAEGRGAAAWTELCDHAGAALAALLAAVVFIPVLGLTRAAALLVALQGLAFSTCVHAQRSASARS
jgi:hypothetical protein